MNPTLANIIAIALPLIITALIAQVSVFLRRHATATQLTTAVNLAHTVVAAVEQIAGVKDWTSEQKYAYAAAMLKMLASRVGITLSDEQIKPLIEGAVRALNQLETNIVTPATALQTFTPDPPLVKQETTAEVLDSVLHLGLAQLPTMRSVVVGTVPAPPESTP